MKLSSKHPIFLLWITFIIFIFYGSLIPFDYMAHPSNLSHAIKDFLTSYSNQTHISRMDVLTNSILYIPLGFLTTAFLLQAGSTALVAVSTGVALSAGTSLVIEIVQTYLPSRNSSMIDFILNTIGGSFGTFFAAFFYITFYDRLKKLWSESWPNRPLAILTRFLGVMIFLGALVPFDFSIQISDLKDAIKGIRWIPFITQTEYPLAWVNLSTNFLLFMAWAALCHLSLWFYSTVRSFLFWKTLCLTMGLAIAIECAQLFIVSRFSNMTDIVISFLGGVGGIMIAMLIEEIPFSGRRETPGAFSKSDPLVGSYYKVIAIIVYSLIIAFLLLAPLDFKFSWVIAKSKISWNILMPFYSYWTRYDLFTAQNLLFKILIFSPLGGLLCFSLRRLPFARLLAFFYCLLLSAAIDALRFFHVSRHPDITNLLTASFGALIGILVVQKFVK